MGFRWSRSFELEYMYNCFGKWKKEDSFVPPKNEIPPPPPLKFDDDEDDVSEEVMTDKNIKKNFSWGPIIKIHKVGEYSIVEYHPQIFKNGSGTGKYSESSLFHPYIGDRDTNCTYDSLDRALLGAICIKSLGFNARADDLFNNMLGI